MSNKSEYTNKSEFTIYRNETIPVVADTILKSTVISCAGIIFIIELVILYLRWTHVQKKNFISKLLIGWTIFQGPFMSLRPLLGICFGLRTVTDIGMAFLTHILGMTAAGIVILFIYVELSIIHRGTIRKNEIYLMEHRGKILLSIHILQSLLFLAGPLLSYYASIPARFAFWLPVILIDFTVIPYFCFLGIIIYQKISKMIHKKYKSVSKQILTTVIVCSILGLFTGSAGVYLMIDTQFEWVLVELCWLSDIFFNAIINFMIIRKQKKKIESTSGSNNTSSK